MILEMADFRRRVAEDRENLIAELQAITGRFGDEEREAMSASFPRLCEAFSHPGFDRLHLYFNGSSALSLEYQLPAASAWCDVVLLGSGPEGPGAVVIELKHWLTHGDTPAIQGLINHNGEAILHPSDQVRGYVEYCRRFHSAVVDHGAKVNGCVFFTRNTNIAAYSMPPNTELAADFPCFASNDSYLAEAFPAFVNRTINAPDFGFALEFERGSYKQDRGFIRHIGQQILNPETSPFVLLDAQRRAFSLCRAQVESALFHQGQVGAKKVIVIEGPPGSGKSVVAARLWAALATDERMPEGPIVFTSTSASQNSNWSHLFGLSAHEDAAGGVVKKATSYTPISTHCLGKLRRSHGQEFLKDASQWSDGVQKLRNLGVQFANGARDGEYLVSVVDEAHALINPEHREGRGQFGFVTGLGPQAYHIMRVSMVTIFLLDPRQGFRSRENTTVQDLKKWAEENGAEFFSVSLAGHQFRCAGSKEYVDWVEAMLAGESPDVCRVLASAWRKQVNETIESIVPENIIAFPESTQLARAAEPTGTYTAQRRTTPLSGRLEMRIFDNPAEMEAALRTQLDMGYTTRLVAPYARKWKTEGIPNPHHLPHDQKDFAIPFVEGGQTKIWSKVWNVVAGNGSDYTGFVQGREGTHMHTDSLSEVGCPYVVRGFDWDYIGLLWFSDLAWNAGSECWSANPDHLFERGFSSLITRAKKEKNPSGPHHQNLLEAVLQSYRILLTRPLRGVYIWFEDPATRTHIESTL